MKKALAAAALLVLMGTAQVEAAKLVTPDIPLESRYYAYIDKLEAMGFITDMTSSMKPYSRWQVAKMLARVNPEGMPEYLYSQYEELCNALSDEIAYAIVHEPLVKTKYLGKSKRKLRQQEKYHQEYYADRYIPLVHEKVKLAGSKHFPANLRVNDISLELSYQQQDRREYPYRAVNASYQPLHGDNSGYRYGRGTNAVGQLTISGSVNNHVALSLTPRFSWDKDEKGDASLREGYVRTNVGIWNVTVGKQQLNWSTNFGNAGVSLSNNATAQNMVRLSLMEPYDTQEWGWFKWLGKIDFSMFYAIQEGNRRDQYKQWRSKGDPENETDHLKFVGARLELQPTDTFTIGLERLSHVKKWGKNWFFIQKDGIDDWKKGDYGNDQNGIDWRLKFPGVQVYGGWHGEDGDKELTDLFTTGRSRRYGVYFPQLAKDGSWDLTVERTFNDTDIGWYTHSKPDGNGWVYSYDIMGDAMGTAADKYRAVVNNYRSNGDILTLCYQQTKWDRHLGNGPKYRELTLSYDHKVKENLHWYLGLGYARILNAGYARGMKEKAKYVAAGVNWSY